MVQAVLKSKGMIVPRRTCHPLTIEEIESKSEKIMRDDFDASISGELGE